MSAFSMFQASFDGGLRVQHRRKARLAAFALTSAAVALIGGTLLTLLQLNSHQLADMANAGTPRDVRTATTEAARQKDCIEQSWPFMEGRCLIDTKSLRQAERIAPRRVLTRQMLAKQTSESQDDALHSRKKRARLKPANGGTLVATRSQTSQTALSTTGAPPRTETASQPPKTQGVTAAISQEKPAAANSSAQKPSHAVAARRVSDQSRREARRKELTREQREARAELRARRQEIRSASRWGEGGYSSSYGGGWQRGPFDGFFSTIR